MVGLFPDSPGRPHRPVNTGHVVRPGCLRKSTARPHWDPRGWCPEFVGQGTMGNVWVKVHDAKPQFPFKRLLPTGKALFCLELTGVAVMHLPETTGAKPFERSPDARLLNTLS